MPRTTLDIEGPILQEVRALQRKEGRSMGKIVSELLAEALAQRKTPSDAPKLTWICRPMRALVDLSDKEALYAVLDREEA
jgi:hypothetical protein